MVFNYCDIKLGEAVYLYEAHGDATVCDADNNKAKVVAEDEE